VLNAVNGTMGRELLDVKGIAGARIAYACDIRVASEYAKFI